MTGEVFEPNAAVTGVGSLPHRDVVQASAFVAQYATEVPFVPQLPNAVQGEHMLLEPFHQALGLLSLSQDGLRVDIKDGGLEEFVQIISDIDDALPVSPQVESFLSRAAYFPVSSLRAFKSQIVGPVTLLSGLNYLGKSLLSFEAISSLVFEHLCREVHAQIASLRRYKQNIIFVVDEPSLPELDKYDSEMRNRLEEMLSSLLSLIHEAGAMPGIHCCQAVSLKRLENYGVEVLSIDVSQVFCSRDFNQAGSELKELVEKGLIFALGVVPVGEKAVGFSAGEELDFITRSFTELGINTGLLFRRSLITPACGLAGCDETSAREVFAAALEYSKLARARFGIETHQVREN